MTTTHPSAALFATPLVDAKLSAHGLGGDVGLELFVDVLILLKFATTVGTRVRQESVERFVDVLGRRRGTMRVWAVILAAFAPRFHGASFGRAFREGAGLALGGTLFLIESPLKLGDSLQEFRDHAVAFDAPRAWSSAFVHAGNLGKCPPCSCAENYLSYGFSRRDR
jgi:hypothetical protein